MRTIKHYTISQRRGDIPVSVYNPGAESTSPSILYLHGGGGVVGNLKTYDGLIRRLAKASEARGVFIGYRLAPEYKYPAAVEDCCVAANYVLGNFKQIGLTNNRIIIAGDSVGAGLAISTCQRLSSRRQSCFLAALLVYGAFGTATDTPVFSAYGDDYWLTTDIINWYWKHYFNDAGDRRAADLLHTNTDLSCLPESYILAAEYDPLCFDSELLAKNLSQAGCKVTLSILPGVIHNFLQMTEVTAEAERAI